MEKLKIYLEMLRIWNEKINLISFSKSNLWNEVVEESKKFLPFSKGKIIDIGTGAGIPGIVVKILKNDVKMYLCESNKKKSFFLEEVIKELNLKNIFIINKNFLELKEYKNFFDRIFSRGLGIKKIEKAKYLLKYNGKMVVYKKGKEVYNKWKRKGDLLIWEK